MSTKGIIKYVFAEAAKSNVEKRKVGAAIVDGNGTIVGAGHNTDDMHAEVAAIADFRLYTVKTHAPTIMPLTMYVSHPPCPECAKAILDAGIANVEVVEEFIKFDGDKLRYDLIPPSATKALAEVLTFGARKYKPNNWRNVPQEELNRYVAAAMRHFEAHRSGEYFDADSGLPHLAHCLTNIAFLIDLDENLRP